MMTAKHETIFQPLQLKTMRLRNRIVMPPMGTNFALPDGSISDHHIKYYEQRAHGGVGLIITENVCVDFPIGANGTTQLRLDEDRFIPGLSRLVDAVHAQGACIAVQINHAGSAAMSSRIGTQPVSASNIPAAPGGEEPRPLAIEEIHKIADKYAQSAARAKQAGFDAVELHAGHSYLLSQFISPTTNDRSDEFGGSAQNRARFARLCLERIRDAVGENYPVSIRISADEMCAGGNTLDDTLEYLEYLDEFVDLYNVSAALNVSKHYQVDMGFLPDGWRSFLAKPIKDTFGKPCMVTGNFRNPTSVDRVLDDGSADLVGIGRGLIADPDWVRKVRKGEEDAIRYCISCNIGCLGNRVANNRPIRCTVNPCVVKASEDLFGKKVTRPTTMVVIGGGTSGLEAACVAARSGCEVQLFERKNELGGIVSEVSKLPAKRRMAMFAKYLKSQADSLPSLHIHLGAEPTLDEIEHLNPDIIVNATGSVPTIPPIEGLPEALESKTVKTVQGFFEDLETYQSQSDLSGKTIAIAGSGGVGMDIAEFFAPLHARIVVVGSEGTLGANMDPMSVSYAREMMDEYGIKFLGKHRVTGVRKSAFICESTEDATVTQVDFDHGFIALGMKPQVGFWNKLSSRFGNSAILANIGASKTGGKIIDGTREAYDLLNLIEQEGFFD